MSAKYLFPTTDLLKRYALCLEGFTVSLAYEDAIFPGSWRWIVRIDDDEPDADGHPTSARKALTRAIRAEIAQYRDDGENADEDVETFSAPRLAILRDARRTR